MGNGNGNGNGNSNEKWKWGHAHKQQKQREIRHHDGRRQVNLVVSAMSIGALPE
jgi:hypothetical protein